MSSARQKSRTTPPLRDLHAKQHRPISQPLDAVDPLLSVRDVRIVLGGVSTASLYRWERAGILPPSIHVGRRKGWRRSAINRVMDAWENAANENAEAKRAA